MNTTGHLKRIFILVIFSTLLFIVGNATLGLTNDNEVFYAQSAKEMIQQRTWLTPYLFGYPQFEKPVLIYWFIKFGFLLFGVSSFSARFFSAFFGVIGVLAVYWLSWIAFRNQKKAFLSGAILMSAAMYIGLSKTVFTDIFFSVFILLTLASFFWSYAYPGRKTIGLLLSSVFCGLAVLTKGPLGLIVPSGAVGLFLLFKKDLKFLWCRSFILSILLFSAVTIPWYALMASKHGNIFIQEFFYNVNARRLVEAQHVGNDTWYFYPMTIITSMFPWSLFILAALFFLPRYILRKDNPIYLFLTCWFAVIFLIFQIAHSKVANYIFPVFPILAILCADFIESSLSNNKHRRLLFILTGCMLFAILMFPIAFMVSFKVSAAYITYKLPVYFLIIAFLILAGFMLTFLIRKRLEKAIYALILVMAIFIFNLPLLSKNFDAYVSSRQACEYLMQNHEVGSFVLSSKSLVRGVKYYTDKDVVIMDIGGKPFFSRHPILTLDSLEKAADFFRKQPVTYCILTKSSLGDMERIANNGISFVVLKKAGNEYVVKVKYSALP